MSFEPLESTYINDVEISFVLRRLDYDLLLAGILFLVYQKEWTLLAIHLLEKQINAFSWRLENQLGSFEPPTFEKVSNGSSIGTPFFFFCVYIYIYIHTYI